MKSLFVASATFPLLLAIASAIEAIPQSKLDALKRLYLDSAYIDDSELMSAKELAEFLYTREGIQIIDDDSNFHAILFYFDRNADSELSFEEFVDFFDDYWSASNAWNRDQDPNIVGPTPDQFERTLYDVGVRMNTSLLSEVLVRHRKIDHLYTFFDFYAVFCKYRFVDTLLDDLASGSIKPYDMMSIVMRL